MLKAGSHGFVLSTNMLLLAVELFHIFSFFLADRINSFLLLDFSCIEIEIVMLNYKDTSFVGCLIPTTAEKESDLLYIVNIFQREKNVQCKRQFTRTNVKILLSYYQIFVKFELELLHANPTKSMIICFINSLFGNR